MIYGWLVICEPDHQSITEMALGLAVSKASVSTVLRQLEQSQMVERVPVPGSRQHHYRARAGGWSQVLRSRFERLGLGETAAEYALSHLTARGPGPSERLNEMRDFFHFVKYEFGDVLTERGGPGMQQLAGELSAEGRRAGDEGGRRGRSA